MSTIYDPLPLSVLQEAEDAAYAQQTYLAQASAMTGPLSSGLPGWLQGGAASNTQLAGSTLGNQTNTAQSQYNQGLANQAVGMIYHNHATGSPIWQTVGGGTILTPTTILPNQAVWPSGGSQLQQMPLHMPPARAASKSVFYSLIEYIEAVATVVRPYDDMVEAMLDRRRFKEDQVSLEAFAAFLVVNGFGHEIERHIHHLEANGVTFVEGP
jgi:hypothetical protein